MLRLRRLLPSFGLAFLTACATGTTPLRAAGAAHAAPEIAGISIRTVERKEPVPLVAHVVRIDLAKAAGVLKVVVERDKRGEGGFVAATVRRLAEKDGLALAVNGGFFEVPGGRYPKAGERAEPAGALILDGMRIAPKGPGLGLLDGGVCFDGRKVWVEKGFACEGARYGLAAGPLLLWKGARMDTAFADVIFRSLRHPRSAVGVDQTKGIVWLLVVDGRQPGVSEGATLDELKEMLKAEGAVDAVNLDGGGSSTLVARSGDGTPKVLNVPVHDHVSGRERPVVSAVGVGTN